MNTFFNNLYQNGEGCTVTGFYREQPFHGKISNVRSTYGGGLNVYVELDHEFTIERHERDSLVLDGEELFNGSGSCTKNLHVYF